MSKIEANWVPLNDIKGDPRWYDSNTGNRKVYYKSIKATCYYDTNGNRHRLEGPAVETELTAPPWVMQDFEKAWYYHGRKIECQSQEEFERLVRLKAFW